MFGGSSTINTAQGRVDDLSQIVGSSSYGAPVRRVWGAARLPGNLVWSSTPIEHVAVSTSSQGGKGGGGVTQRTEDYWYSCSFAYLFCRGPVYGISKLWANGVPYFDLADDASAGAVAKSNLLLDNITFYSGTEIQTQDPTIAAAIGIDDTPAYRGSVLAVFRDIDLRSFQNRIPTISAYVVEHGELYGGNQIRPLKRSVASIIDELCQEAGIDEANIDVSALTDEIYGLASEGASYREVLDELLQAFAIRVVRSGPVFRFMPGSSGTPVATLTADDLGQADAGKIGVQLRRTRTRPYGLPRKVQVGFSDIGRDGEANAQTRQRMAAGGSANDIKIDLRLVLSSTDAARIAESELYRSWVRRDEFELALGPRWLELDAGDVVAVNTGTKLVTLQIDKLDIGFNGMMKAQARAFDAAASVSTASGVDGGSSGADIGVAGATVAHFLDLPALSDNLAGAQIFVAAAGASSSWRSAGIWRSVDGGSTYQSVGELSTYSIIGEALTTLANPPATGAAWWDTVSTLDVELLRGSLEGVSDDLVLAGANALLVGNEIIQFANATLIGTRTYRLSRLLRGRRGTEWAMTGHAADERVVLLSTIGVGTASLAEIGAARLYKIVPNGQAVDDVDPISFTWNGEVLRPFSPVQAKATRDGGQNIALSWIRRSRIGQELPSGTDIPLGEAYEAYSVDVLNGGGSVVRTLATVSSPSATYSAADQTTDFGAPQSSVRFRIHQISDAVGRGRALDVTL
jgi:hypothetical protein